MQRLPFPHLVAQRYDHGELQAAVSGVVQNDVPDELHKKGFSTNELQKQLGLKRYEPVWAMVHKLRRAMGNRDARYTLEGMIELDEGYFSVASKEIERGKGTRGRGAEGKQNVAVMAESTPLEDIETGKKEKHVRYFKARVLDSHQSEGINGVVRDCMEDDAIVFSDKSTSYVDISDLVELHVTEKSDAKTTKETLKWVHIAISNAKRTLLGNYHKIKRKYLQLYLNEFIYKLNRRYFGDKLFDRLVIANITDAKRIIRKIYMNIMNLKPYVISYMTQCSLQINLGCLKK